MDRDNADDAMLEGFFEAVKANRPAPTDDFMARLMADTEAAVPQVQTAVADRPRQTALARLKGIFAASGLSAAAALGVWIGFAMPDLVNSVSPTTDDVVGISSFLAGADLAMLSE